MLKRKVVKLQFGTAIKMTNGDKTLEKFSLEVKIICRDV